MTATGTRGVLIVDDEPPARRKIRRFLKSHPDFAVLGDAGNGEEAIRSILERRPDLVFLDIQMPGLDGFDVVRAVGPEHMPRIVFVTAFDQFALRAFDVHALDYLLKPFDRRRFDAAVARARSSLTALPLGGGHSEVRRLLARLDRPPRYLDRILIKSAGRVTFLRSRDVAWIEGASNYVKLHANAAEYLLRETLDGIGRQLDPHIFARVHRSYLVNLDHIDEMHPWSHGDYLLRLRDGTELRLSRRYRDRLPPQFAKQL